MSNTPFAATFTRRLALLAALAVVGALLAGVQPAKAAGFSGYYDPANWTTIHHNPDTTPHGHVDTSGVPNSITIVGPNNGSGEYGDIRFLIETPVAGTFSFDWSYFSVDDPGFDAGFYADGEFFQFLSDTSGQSGSISVPVGAGAIIGFAVASGDNQFGPGELTISNFSAPIPEPATLTLAALCLLGLAAMRRRR